ncbi:356_t:CDS:2 [Paraglomus brasilianum]|uniref:356_t:CDS:1 n=1 Tax=Paraglomus brasilianum TaxID=144538 RepID=A0A9N9F9G7_9GLOM|nr:356_t:CDS:2 [Paraglomus brasilianum]
MDDLKLFCLVQGNAIAQAFPLSINRNENIGQLKKAIKAKKIPEFNFFDADRLKIWKVQIRADNDKEPNKLTLHNNDQLLASRKISSYFTDKPLDKHIHIVVKPPKLIHISLNLVLEVGLLNEGGSVEYLGRDRIYKATLRESCLCTKDGKYSSFIEFIRVARRLKPDETPIPYDFHSLRINNMTYQEVRDKIYKFVSYKYEDSLFIDHFSIPWDDDLENRLRQLHSEKDVVEIFWGRSLKEDEATWRVYVICRSISYLRKKRTETVMEDQMIRFRTIDEGLSNAEIRQRILLDSQSREIPKKLQKAFDEALDNELGQSFREMHYNLVGMSTGYKRIQKKLTKIPAIILYVRQKGILRRGCDKFPNQIRGYPVDVVEARSAIPYGYGVTSCQTYKNGVSLGSSIGITESQGTSGTLSAVVRDKKSEQTGILSCEHVCRFCESSTGMGVIIHQPSHKDLDNLIQKFDELGYANPAFKKILEDPHNISMINEVRQNSALACYERGMRRNFFSKVHQKNFGVDTAFCISKNSNRTLCPNKFAIPKDLFEKANLPEDTLGRATGLTLGKLVPIDSAISIDLTNESIKFAEEQGGQGQIPLRNNNDLIGYMKSPLIQEIDKKCQKCYPTVWFDRQLIFKFNYEDFRPGDSGASVMDKGGKALGILHALWITDNFRYAIASPYFAVFEALDVVEI